MLREVTSYEKILKNLFKDNVINYNLPSVFCIVCLCVLKKNYKNKSVVKLIRTYILFFVIPCKGIKSN